MANPGVGADIEDTCARCGESWHAVMAKVADRIAKVVCKRCGSQHNYRGGAAGLPTADSAGAGAATTGTTTGRRMVRRKAYRSSEPEPVVTPEFDPSKPPRPYSVREPFAAGERIVHPTFGTGVVSGTPGPGKVDVVFPTGARTLACAKVQSTLARPTAVQTVVFADRPPEPKV